MKGGAWHQARIYALGLVLSKSTGLILLPLVTHQLTPADFGRLEFLQTFVAAGVVISSTWLVETLFRFAAAPAEEGQCAAADVTGLGLAIAGCLFALFAIGAPFLTAILPVQVSAVEIALAGAVIAAEAMNSIPLGWLRMRNRARHWAVLVTARMVLHLVLTAVLLAAGFGVAGVLAAGVAASLAVGAVLVLAQAKEGGLRIAPQRWVPLLAYGAPLTVSGLALFALNSADLWFLAGHVPTAALGLYALAVKIALIAQFASQPFELWWYPRRQIVLREANGLAKSARLAGFGAALALVSAAGTAVMGPLLIQALTPASYHAAGLLLPWMVMGIAMQLLGGLVNVGCYLGTRGTEAGMVNLGSAGLVLLLYLLLIPGFGIAGAIAATLLAQFARMVAFGLLSHRHAPIPYPFGALSLLAAASIATAALPQIAGTPAGFAGVLACLLLAGALRLTPSGRRPFAR